MEGPGCSHRHCLTHRFLPASPAFLDFDSFYLLPSPHAHLSQWCSAPAHDPSRRCSTEHLHSGWLHCTSPTGNVWSREEEEERKRNRSRKTASGLCLRFCETATKWQQNWGNQGFSHSALHRPNSQSGGSMRGWECKNEAGASSLRDLPKS